ncbi:MAG: gluconokinase [Propionibacteriaceae bacterium]|nr:gluconokinase [Propionibacteriaceae bacterium]
MSTHIVVMGVSGCGKTTVARSLAARLGWDFAEGDELHPPANIAKMSAGRPLTDADRRPWLAGIVAWTVAARGDTVVSCSALRRSYRDQLRAAGGRTLFVHLDLPEPELTRRMAGRTGHFMPVDLLPSQLATLERLQPDEEAVVITDPLATEAVVEAVVEHLGNAGAGFGPGNSPRA